MAERGHAKKQKKTGAEQDWVGKGRKAFALNQRSGRGTTVKRAMAKRRRRVAAKETD